MSGGGVCGLSGRRVQLSLFSPAIITTALRAIVVNTTAASTSFTCVKRVAKCVAVGITEAHFKPLISRRISSEVRKITAIIAEPTAQISLPK